MSFETKDKRTQKQVFRDKFEGGSFFKKVRDKLKKIFIPGSPKLDVIINKTPCTVIINTIKESEEYLAKERGMLFDIPRDEMLSAYRVIASGGLCGETGCRGSPVLASTQRMLGLRTHFVLEPETNSSAKFPSGYTCLCSSMKNVTIEQKEQDDKPTEMPPAISAYYSNPLIKILTSIDGRMAQAVFTLKQWAANEGWRSCIALLPGCMMGFVILFFGGILCWIIALPYIPWMMLNMLANMPDIVREQAAENRLTENLPKELAQEYTVASEARIEATRLAAQLGMKRQDEEQGEDGYDVTEEKVREAEEEAKRAEEVLEERKRELLEGKKKAEIASEPKPKRLVVEFDTHDSRYSLSFPKSEEMAARRIFKYDIKATEQDPTPFWTAFLEKQDLEAIDKEVKTTQEAVIAQQNEALKESAKEVFKEEVKATAKAKKDAAWAAVKESVAPLLKTAQENFDGELKFVYASQEVVEDAMDADEPGTGNDEDEPGTGNDEDEPGHQPRATKLLAPLIKVMKKYSKPKNKLDIIYEAKAVAVAHAANGVNGVSGVCYVAISPQGKAYLVIDSKKQWQTWTKHSFCGLRAFNKAGAEARDKAIRGSLAKADAARKAKKARMGAKGAIKGAINLGITVFVNFYWPGDPFGIAGLLRKAIDMDFDFCHSPKAFKIKKFIPGIDLSAQPFYDCLRIKRSLKHIIAEKLGGKALHLAEEEEKVWQKAVEKASQDNEKASQDIGKLFENEQDEQVDNAPEPEATVSEGLELVVEGINQVSRQRVASTKLGSEATRLAEKDEKAVEEASQDSDKLFEDEQGEQVDKAPEPEATVSEGLELVVEGINQVSRRRVASTLIQAGVAVTAAAVIAVVSVGAASGWDYDFSGDENATQYADNY